MTSTRKFLDCKVKKKHNCRSCGKRLQKVAVKKVKDIGKPEGGAL
jgi:rRNA maturation endonuclease Nob1